jgi:hypothetical protein
MLAEASNERAADEAYRSLSQFVGDQCRLFKTALVIIPAIVGDSGDVFQ